MECGKVGEHYEIPYFHPRPNLLEWPCQEQHVSGSTASAPASDISVPVCTNGVLPLLQLVSVAQKTKPLIM